MTLDELIKKIFEVDKPYNWREGQFVFNRAEQLFGGIVRTLNVDCFYDNTKINEFIDALYEALRRE